LSFTRLRKYADSAGKTFGAASTKVPCAKIHVCVCAANTFTVTAFCQLHRELVLAHEVAVPQCCPLSASCTVRMGGGETRREHFGTGSLTGIPERVSRLGNSGRSSQNIERDFHRYADKSTRITPYWVRVPIKRKARPPLRNFGLRRNDDLPPPGSLVS
jgi:hypothetical protein